jgi:hypothetical protein
MLVGNCINCILHKMSNSGKTLFGSAIVRDGILNGSGCMSRELSRAQTELGRSPLSSFGDFKHIIQRSTIVEVSGEDGRISNPMMLPLLSKGTQICCDNTNCWDPILVDDF